MNVPPAFENARSFAGNFRGFLRFFEKNEVSDLSTGFLIEGEEVLPELTVVPVARWPGIVEKRGHVELEDRQDLEQRIEADLVFSFFHPRQVGLEDSDFLGKLGLSEVPSLPKGTDSRADQVLPLSREMLLHHILSANIIRAL